MKATESPLVQMLKGPRQFLIPIYQRAYKWTEEQCAQLWEDVIRVAQDARYPAHFIGSMVYIEHGLYQATTIPQLLVIDGQQRLTTVSLMIEALARALESQEASSSTELTARKLRNYFLLNPEEVGDWRYKLQPSQGDVETFRAIIDGKALPENPARHMVDNFEYFQEQLEETAIDPEALYSGISKLLVVDVALDRDHDNPQLIFESLNSTGLDLSQSDLIRNYVLMGLAPAEQEELYKDHWRPIEETLGRADREDAFDRFLRAWLTLRLGEVPNIRRGYETFKRYRLMHAELPIAELLRDLHACANHYACIALGQEKHPELAKAFAGLQALRVDAPMPFLLHAYSLRDAGAISDDEMLEIARLMESWLFRRAVCDIPSNVLSRTFAVIRGRLDDARLLESLTAYLTLRTGKQRFPRDDEFRAALTSRNLYDFKHRQYCLTRLENHRRKELVSIGDYTIEHVMPQNDNLSSAWQAMLGPDWKQVQERWLHTLGNLTLTGYNPELSDRPFEDKRDMAGGFGDSPIRLNRSLAKQETWNAEAIRKRGEEFAQLACSIWPAPDVDAPVLERYRTTTQRVHVPQQDLAHFKMEDEAAQLYAHLLDRAESLGLEPTIWTHFVGIHKPGAGKPYPLMVYPRRKWLRLQMPIDFDSIPSPPACASRHASWEGRTRVDARSSEHVDACFALLQLLPGVARADLSESDWEEDDS